MLIALGAAGVTFAATMEGIRSETELATNWRFVSSDGSGRTNAEFDDSAWQNVSVPHCWGWEDAQRGDTHYYRGVGWYRRVLELQPKPLRRYFLKFEAASLVADVFINGSHLGQHRGGFGAFCFEITTNLAASGTNLIAVKVDNSSQPDIAPLSGDFNVYGGLYRPVQLVETAGENFAPTDHGSPGVAWLETSVSDAQAVVDVTAQISTGRQQPQPLQFVARILDAAGREVASTSQSIVPAADTTAPCWARLVVRQPHLWNGRKDPYLYRAVVELRSAERVVDAVEQPLGLRYYRVDPDKGFFLNGKPYPIYGVCRHQDRLDKGWAISDADMESDLALIKEIGATAVRCAHYQHSDYFYTLCDRAGILVWAEIPQVNAVHATPEFEGTSRNQLLDLIRQNINHPSIFAWSLFNEIAGGGMRSTDDPHRVLQNLNNLAHGEDPTRPTIAATCVEFFPQMEKIPDLLGWNNYPGWYGGPNYTIPGKPSGFESLKTFGDSLDRRRYQSRNGGFCVAEYGAGANPNQHEENPNPPVAAGLWHPEEWQDIVHESDWAAIKSHPFIWGSFVWNMFDFCVSTRHEGGTIARNDKGLVAFDHQTRKDAFYFYKANWSAEPVLYLASRRFTERTNALTSVKVYSNLPKATLVLNGREIGPAANDGNGVMIWKDVRLALGENNVEVTGRRNGQTLSDHCVWTLTPAS